MSYLIVNADDFGLTAGVNRGIHDAHRGGIVTSASLMVLRAAAEDAAARVRTLPELSVGLHLELADGIDDPAAEVARQCRRFEELLGRPPTHLDSHRDRHLHPRWLPAVVAYGRGYGIPVRGRAAVTRVSGFYGQWHGASHLEQISVDSLIHLVSDIGSDGVSELVCHPGYADADLQSGYAAERDTEVTTLCDPRVRDALARLDVKLISFADFPSLPVPRPAGSDAR